MYLAQNLKYLRERNGEKQKDIAAKMCEIELWEMWALTQG